MKYSHDIREKFGYACVGIFSDDGVTVAVDKEHKYFHINSDGEPLYEERYDAIVNINDKFSVGIINATWLLFNRSTGQAITNIRFTCETDVMHIIDKHNFMSLI